MHVQEENNLRCPFDSRLRGAQGQSGPCQEDEKLLNLESQIDSQVVLLTVQTWLFPLSISVRIGPIHPILGAKLKHKFIASFKRGNRDAEIKQHIGPNSRLNCNLRNNTNSKCYRAIIKC
jgi:hypothetical protein